MFCVSSAYKGTPEAKNCGIPIRFQPAWLVSTTNDNPYNRKTREILDSFADMEIPVGEGNIIFPEGNALRNLREYFTDELPENPYLVRLLRRQREKPSCAGKAWICLSAQDRGDRSVASRRDPHGALQSHDTRALAEGRAIP